MQTQLQLFPDEYSESFGEILSKVNPILPFLWQSYDVPFQDWRLRREADDRFKFLDHYAAAQWLHPQIVHEAEAIFSEIDGATIRRRKGIFVVDYDDVHVHFKKLGKGFRHSNYPTWHNSQYWSQSFPLDHPPRVILGYRLYGNLMASSLYLTMPLSQQSPLYVEIPDQTDQLIQLSSDQDAVTDEADEYDDLGFHVEPKEDGGQEEA